MSLLGGDLAALLGAAFGSLYADAVLHKVVTTDLASGGFSVATTDYPAKAMIETLSDQARAASGLPQESVSISLLRGGLRAAADLDDSVSIAGAAYRVIRVETDPAGAAWSLIAVPA